MRIGDVREPIKTADSLAGREWQDVGEETSTIDS